MAAPVWPLPCGICRVGLADSEAGGGLGLEQAKEVTRWS